MVTTVGNKHLTHAKSIVAQLSDSDTFPNYVLISGKQKCPRKLSPYKFWIALQKKTLSLFIFNVGKTFDVNYH